MSQHDFTVADQSHTNFRADMNLALKALASTNSGATEPATMYAFQLWADTTAGLLKQRNSGNSAWLVRGTLATTFVISRSSNTILAKVDHQKTFVATAGFTQTLTAVATLADGWYVYYRVESGATILFDPNASENIDGATTKSVVGPSSGIIFCTGSAFLTIGFATGVAASQAEQEAGSSTSAFATPGRQQFHPSACKQWGRYDTAGTISASYNTASIVDRGTGQVDIVIATDMSSAGYCVLVATQKGNQCSDSFVDNGVLPAATGYTISNTDVTNALIDPNYFTSAAFGDQ